MNAMKVEFIYQVRVSMNDLGDTFTSESLLPESSLDIVKDLSVWGVVLIENVLQVEVRWTQTVTEVLSEDPSTVCQMTSELGAYSQLLEQLTSIYGFLDSMATWYTWTSVEEGVVRKSVEQRSFLGDLEDWVLNWRCVGVWQRVEVQRDDGNTIAKLF